MLSIFKKRSFLISTIKNGNQYLSQGYKISSNNIRKHSELSAYNSATSLYSYRLQNLESNLTLMEEIREETHKKIIKEMEPKIMKLKNCICNDKSDIIIGDPLVTGLVLPNDFVFNLFFVVLGDEIETFDSDFNLNLQFQKGFINTIIKLIKADTSFWDDKRDTIKVKYGKKILLCFGDKTQLHINFAANDQLRYLNLFRYYAASDVRFRKLYFYVKMLLLNMKKIGGLKRLLDNRNIFILVSHFLQTSFENQQAVLPFLTDVYSAYLSPSVPTKDVIENLYKPVDVSEIQPLINPKPLASHLVMQFIDYFANPMSYKSNIYLNKFNPVKECEMKRKSKILCFYTNKRLCSYDNNLNMYLECMKRVQYMIKKGQLIDDLPNYLI
uniref:LETM1 domain-containing protein n=1 Tax=Strongyloides venezuelensis TaxID=75913 RepID=A0A0K0F2R6_STRVS